MQSAVCRIGAPLPGTLPVPRLPSLSVAAAMPAHLEPVAAPAPPTLLVVPVLMLGLVMAAPAPGAELHARIVDSGGRPVADAVVSLEPLGAALVAPAASAITRTIDQVDETFVPYVEVFRPGDSVVFENSDSTRHHAYSFSPTRPFEMELAPGERSQALVLERSGVVSVGCNIHDRMVTHLFVATTPWFARTGSDGVAVLTDLPAGGYRVTTWHPQLRDPTSTLVRTVALKRADSVGETAFTLSLLPDPRGERGPERIDY